MALAADGFEPLELEPQAAIKSAVVTMSPLNIRRLGFIQILHFEMSDLTEVKRLKVYKMKEAVDTGLKG